MIFIRYIQRQKNAAAERSPDDELLARLCDLPEKRHTAQGFRFSYNDRLKYVFQLSSIHAVLPSMLHPFALFITRMSNRIEIWVKIFLWTFW